MAADLLKTSMGGKAVKILWFRKELSAAGLSLFLANAAYWMIAGTYTPFLSSYFTSVGLTAMQTGVLLMVQPLAVLFVQPVWAYLSDRTAKRKLVLGSLIIGAAISILLYYVGTQFEAVLFATVMFSVFFSALLPLSDALVIDGCLTKGIEFAGVRLGGTLGYAFIVFIVGVYLEKVPRAQFVVVALLCVLFLVVVTVLPNGQHAVSEVSACNRLRLADVAVGLDAKRPVLGAFESHKIYFVLAFAFVSQMGLGFSGSFIGRHVLDLGYGQGLVGILSAISALSEIPVLLLADSIMCRWGEMRLLIASCFFMVLRLVFIGFGLVPTMVAGQLLQSVTYMTVYYSCARYVAEHVLPGRQSQGQSVLVAVQSGLAMLIANLAGGFAGDTFGMQMSFFLSAVLVLTATLVVLAVYRHTRCYR